MKKNDCLQTALRFSMNYSDLTDLELFALVKQDDNRAFEELYHRYVFILKDIARKKLGQSDRAEDIVHDIFLSLYHRRHHLEILNFSAYIHRSLKFGINNELRHLIVRRNHSALFSMPVCKTDLAENLEAKQLNNKIHKVLKKMPDKCRHAFILSRFEQFPYKKISATLNISVSTVEKHIIKALNIMRTELSY